MIESKRELQTSAVDGVGLVLCAGSERTHSEAGVNFHALYEDVLCERRSGRTERLHCRRHSEREA